MPREGRFLWLDTTPEVAPYGFLLQGLRNQQALVIPSEGPAKLMKTPANPENPQRQDFSMEGTLSSDGLFSGRVQQVYEGDVAVSLRAAFRQVPQSQWKESVQRISYNLNFGGEVERCQGVAARRHRQALQNFLRLPPQRLCDSNNHHTSPALPPMGIEATRGIREQKPDEPVPLGSPGKVEYHSRVELPQGYRVVAPPRVELIESYAEYRGATNIEDGVMTTTRELDVKKTEVPLSEWEGFRRFGTAVADDEFNQLSVEHSGPETPTITRPTRAETMSMWKNRMAPRRKRLIPPNSRASFAKEPMPCSSATSGRAGVI